LSILWSNPLVGSISTLALILLLWPLLSLIIAKLRPPKSRDFAAEQPVD
jgi:putative tricarboxylic transport membrane protein